MKGLEHRSKSMFGLYFVEEVKPQGKRMDQGTRQNQLR